MQRKDNKSSEAWVRLAVLSTDRKHSDGREVFDNAFYYAVDCGTPFADLGEEVTLETLRRRALGVRSCTLIHGVRGC